MAFEDRETLESASGAAIALRRQPAEGGEKGLFILSHGLAEHSLRYAPLARLLAARGYTVYGFDHRGHGFTTADDAPRGRFARRDGEGKLMTDLAAVRDRALAEHPGLPVILFGHSMGGIIAARAAECEPGAYAGLCIWNSHLDPGLAGRLGLLLLKAERFFKGSDVPSRFGPALTLDSWARSVENPETPFDWLSRDRNEVACYIADPLCGFDCSVSLWIDLIGMALAAGRTASLARLPPDLPINIVGGGRDPATDEGRAMTWLAGRLRRLDITKVHLTIYPDMRHETLNEIGRGQAMDMLADWADAVVSGQGATR
ncbi:MAG: alpha/beta hydrolase [Rhizobiaceae bacterium]|nr:alpha/beta hydrolase [Rhizobiaceae bacterium]